MIQVNVIIQICNVGLNSINHSSLLNRNKSIDIKEHLTHFPFNSIPCKKSKKY